MAEKEMIINSITNFLKNNTYRTDDIIDMYNMWSLTENIQISNKNVLFSINVIRELMTI